MPDLRETLIHVRERLTTPTDVALVQRFADNGVNTVVTVPCSITQTMDPIWNERAGRGEMNYWRMVNEHSLIGVTSGAWFGTGDLALAHMQNSGIGNALDGFVSFAGVYKIPTLAVVTWRGNDAKDDSEPHQEIGTRTSRLTRDVVDGRSVFGDRRGRGILRKIDEATAWARDGNQSIIRLSPYSFEKATPMPRIEISETESVPTNFRLEELRASKGDSIDAVFSRVRVSRKEGIQSVLEQPRFKRAVKVLSNGFTAREAQDQTDELGNFYNAGYMGGGLAIGWGMAKSNPDIDVVVVDGDQNAEMGKMTEILATDYPPNLHWVILDNGYGASVGVSESRPLPWWYYDLAQVIRTVPDQPGEFKSPRVGKRGVYFDMDEAKALSDMIGPLPVHAQRLRHWIKMTSEENRNMRSSVDRYRAIDPSQLPHYLQ